MSEIKLDNFTTAKRDEYMQDAFDSLDALITDALLGEDQNGIKSEFPQGCKAEDISVENSKVSLSFLNGADEAMIEVVVQIGYQEAAFGEYKSVYDLEGELLDEFFFLD